MRAKRLGSVLLLLSCVCLGADAAPSASALVGRWETTIQLGKAMKFKVVLNVQQTAEGKIEGKIDIPEQGARNVPVNAMLFNSPAVRWEIDAFNTAFNGKLEESGNEIAGGFDDGPGGRPLNVTFRRVERAAEPKPVYSLAAGETPDFRGYWEGVMDPSVERASRVGLKIGRLPDKTFCAELDMFDRGEIGLPASTVTTSNATLVLNWEFQHISLTAQLNGTADQLAGDWSSGPKSSSINLKRLDKPAMLLPPNLSFVPKPDTPEDLRGEWKGALNVQGHKLRLVLRVGQTPDGRIAGTLVSPDQGGGELPISSVGYTNPVVRLEFKGINGVFSGKLNPAGTQMDGDWKQMGPPLDLQFVRTQSNAGGKQ